MDMVYKTIQIDILGRKNANFKQAKMATIGEILEKYWRNIGEIL